MKLYSRKNAIRGGYDLIRAVSLFFTAENHEKSRGFFKIPKIPAVINTSPTFIEYRVDHIRYAGGGWMYLFGQYTTSSNVVYDFVAKVAAN